MNTTDEDVEGAPSSEGNDRSTSAAPEGEAADRASDPLTELASERDRLKDQLLRAVADLDNYRKRARKDMEEVERRAKEDALRDFLPVFDNLERAVEAAGSAKDVQAIVDGVSMVLKMFEDSASRLGLERVAAVGQRFDPNVHDAIQQKETDEHPPGTIVAELVPGYRLGGRLLRAAMVVVARAPSAASPPQE